MKGYVPVVAAMALCTAANAGLVYNNGGPDYLNGNEMTMWTQAEDFMLGSATTLTSVDFSMLDTVGGLATWDGSLHWWVYQDAGGLPGALYANGSAQNVNAVFDQNVAGWDFYNFSFDFGGGGVAVAANTTYWLALHAASDWQNRDDLYWASTAANNTFFGAEDFQNGGVWSSNGVEHSFALYDIPAPGAFALLGLAGLVSRRRR
ncbi:MAG: hypothetical protein JSV91_07185 [Phycisphaerales bacterium]|nr:MAG: hypothetical protein JSV91_07185 [Phycisphaerales bacterium]